MIKHSFIRSSKVPKLGFSTSLHQSPTKQPKIQEPLHKLRQSFDLVNRPHAKQTSINQKFLKNLLEESVQEFPAKQSLQSHAIYSRDELDALKSKVFQLETQIRVSRGLEERLTQVEQHLVNLHHTSTQSTVNKQLCKTQQRSASKIRKNTQKEFEIMDSEMSEDLSIASLKDTFMEKSMINQQVIVKRCIEEYLDGRQESGEKMRQIENNIWGLEKQIKEMRQREISVLEIIEKYHDQSMRQIRTATQGLRTEFNQCLKYQITKNNQFFFKMKSNQKSIADIVNSKLEEERRQTNTQMDLLRIFTQDVKLDVIQKITTTSRQMHRLQQQIQNVLQNVLEQVNSSLQQIKSEESELATISGSLMDIIKCLVKKSGMTKEVNQKPLELLDIIKSNIIDINALKIEQTMMNKEISNLRPPPISSRRESRVKLGNVSVIDSMFKTMKVKIEESSFDFDA